MALCHVLLKTYGPNDVLLLASFFTMRDESLVGYYGSEIESEMPSPPDEKGNTVNDTIFRSKCSLVLTVESKNKLKELVKKVLTASSPMTASKDPIPAEDRPKDGKNINALFLMRY